MEMVDWLVEILSEVLSKRKKRHSAMPDGHNEAGTPSETKGFNLF